LSITLPDKLHKLDLSAMPIKECIEEWDLPQYRGKWLRIKNTETVQSADRPKYVQAPLEEMIEYSGPLFVISSM
jgi:hypothetical protein